LLEIQLRDGSRLTLDENTRLALRQYAAETEPDSMIQVFRGRLRAWVGEVFSSREESFRVRTPTAIVGVQGTDFLVASLGLVTRVEVFAGLVSVISSDPNVGGRTLLRPGQFTEVRKGQGPQPAAGRSSGGRPGSGGVSDLRSGGIQSQDPLLLTPNVNAGPVLPPNPNPPRP
jgi:ferric-dicitrate binding protein FerR (iron transport regulator)